MIDKTGKQLFFNESVERVLGYKVEEVIGKSFSKFVLKRDIPKYLIQLKHIFMKNEIRNFITQIYHKDGHLVDVEINGKLIKHKENYVGLGTIRDITQRKLAEEKEKEHHRNIILLSDSAMKFVEFQQDENIYKYIGERLRDFIGEDSFVIVNSVDEEAHSSTIQAVLGMGKFTEKISKLFGRHPVGMTIDAEDPNIHYTDGKLHVYDKGIHGLSFKTVPKAICESLEKLLKIKKIYVIDLTKQEHFFGNIIILLQDDIKDLKNKQVIETFIKQASIAVQKRQAEDDLKKRMQDLEIFYEAAVGRELKINEHRKEINELLEKLGQKPKYKIVE